MRAPFLSLEELNTSSAEELAATIASADDEHQRLETEDKIESQELTQLEEHIDNAQVATTAIDETAERLETTYPEGVPDEVVQTLEPVLEALKNVVGFKPGSMKVAVEGLSGKERTRVAVEGLKETANKIWEAIKAAFKRLVEFFKSIFTRQGRQRAAVEKKLDAAFEAIEKEIGKHNPEPIGEIPYPKACLLPGGQVPTLEKLEHWVGTENRTHLEFYKTVNKQIYELHDFCAHKFFKIKDLKDVGEVRTEFAEWSKRANSQLFDMTHDGTIKSSIGGFQWKFGTYVTNTFIGGGPALHYEVENQDVTGTDMVIGPAIPYGKGKPLLDAVEKAHGAWPGDDELAKIPKMVEYLYSHMTNKVDAFRGDFQLASESRALLQDIMKRLNAYAAFSNWIYKTVMTVMMGICSICISSAGVHALNAKFGK